MRVTWVILIAVLVGLIVALMGWLGHMPGPGNTPATPAPPPAAGPPPLRIGVVPERNIYEQLNRYRQLTAYLQARLGQPVEAVTLNTYQAVLQDFQDGKLDAAFLGSLAAVLTLDRCKARVLVKPVVEVPDPATGKLIPTTTYRGVIFVRDDSPIRDIAGLARKTIGMVKTTTAGHLFPKFVLFEAGLLDGPDAPTTAWPGTHDEAIQEVVDRHIDAGAAKDLRVMAWQADHPQVKLRWLAVGPPVPNNALVVHRDMPPQLRARLRQALLGMDSDDAGRRVLADFGALRFVDCDIMEYQAICEMVKKLGDNWKKMAIEGPPPDLKLGCDTPTTASESAE
ncbi:MAG: putative phosphite transport system-binding protein PtxB [Phycisphaerae bacterium]|nr:putative phosphite transport system-binding protein PtxB [Phycisphaerae bacterium]